MKCSYGGLVLVGIFGILFFLDGLVFASSIQSIGEVLPCKPTQYTSKLKIHGIGYKFSYWSGVEIKSRQTKCYRYLVQNAPGSPLTPVLWIGQNERDRLFDGLLDKCPRNASKCEPSEQVRSGRDARLLQSRLSWGLASKEYYTYTDAYRDEIIEAKGYPPQFWGMKGAIADEKGKPVRLFLLVTSEVSKTKEERFQLEYTFRASGSFGAIFLFNADPKVKGEFPVLTWAEKTSPLLAKMFTKMRGSIRITKSSIEKPEVFIYPETFRYPQKDFIHSPSALLQLKRGGKMLLETRAPGYFPQ